MRTSDNRQHELSRRIELSDMGSRSCWIVTLPSRVIPRESTTSSRWHRRLSLALPFYAGSTNRDGVCRLLQIDVHWIGTVGGSADVLRNDVAFPAGSELSQSNPGGFESMLGVFLSGFNA